MRPFGPSAGRGGGDIDSEHIGPDFLNPENSGITIPAMETA